MSIFEKTIVTDENGVPIDLEADGKVASVIYDPNGVPLKLELDGSVAVSIQDQHSPALIVPMNQVTNQTDISALLAIDDLTVDVDVVTGFIDGAFITITNIVENRYYTAKQVGAISGSTVTLDTPLDFAFPAGSRITNGTVDMAVNGSITPQYFSLRAADPGIPVEIDITRIIFKCLTATAVDAEKFGDLAALINGIVLRVVDDSGPYYNVFNAKTNLDLAGMMYDLTFYEAINPTQGVDGFVGRLTFAGQNKIGVTIRVGTGQDLQMIIQDNLSGLDLFELTVEGHVVVP